MNPNPSAAQVESPQPHASSPARNTGYRISALFAGLRYLPRGWAVGVPVLVINALLQVLLILPTRSEFSPATLLLTGVASALLWLLVVALLIAASWLAIGGTPSGEATTTSTSSAPRLWPGVLAHLRCCGWQLGVSILVAAVVSMAGFAAWLWLGVVLGAVSAILPIATVAGLSPWRGYALLLRYRSARWLITTVLIAVMGAVAIVVTGIQWFFIPGVAGSILGTLMWGFLLWWWGTALALITRSALLAPTAK